MIAPGRTRNSIQGSQDRWSGQTHPRPDMNFLMIATTMQFDDQSTTPILMLIHHLPRVNMQHNEDGW